MAMERSKDLPRWDIMQCCECKKYYDKKTRKIVEKPDGVIMSHGLCDKCAAKIEAEIAAYFDRR